MNIFNKHPQQQGLNYIEHLNFAMGIALRLFSTVTAFTLHAIFPFIDIKRRLDLEETANFIQERNKWIENIKRGEYVDSNQATIKCKKTEGLRLMYKTKSV